jgi:peptide chain release factor 1
LPEVEDVDIQIPDKDIEIEVYRSAGAGGQNVQKNSTAVRIRHLPTGMVVQCQDERSQLQNRLRAMSILRARLYDMERAKRDQKQGDARRSQVGSAERSEKIRTYNYPQARITDHRIEKSVFGPRMTALLDGDLDEFIDELATRDEAERLQAAGLS